MRYRDEDDKAGLLALLKIEPRGGNAFTIEPRYVKANNARAVTMAGDAKTPPTINLSLSVTTRGIGRHETRLAGLFPAGEGVVSVSKVEVGPGRKSYTCNTRCPLSDLIPYPDGSGLVSVSVGVTETGEIGFDLDQRTAELKAIKEAMGPALSDAISETLKKD